MWRWLTVLFVLFVVVAGLYIYFWPTIAVIAILSFASDKGWRDATTTVVIVERRDEAKRFNLPL